MKTILGIFLAVVSFLLLFITQVVIPANRKEISKKDSLLKEQDNKLVRIQEFTDSVMTYLSPTEKEDLTNQFKDIINEDN